jgi:hypothetical protein
MQRDPMDVKRAATLGVGGGALAVWLAAAATSGVRVSAPPEAAVITPIEISSAALAAEIARLHDRLRPSSTPREPVRNPFQFTPHGAMRSAPARSPRDGSIAASTQPPAVPNAPALKLSGIAEDPGADGPIRTAIISGEGQLFLVKEGEFVTPRYRVATISADVVEVVEVDTNRTLRLAMRP